MQKGTWAGWQPAIHREQCFGGKRSPCSSRWNVKGEWTEQCFPMTKELREKLSAVVLAEYDRALAAEDGGGTPAA